MKIYFTSHFTLLHRFSYVLKESSLALAFRLMSMPFVID